ncbi:CHML [Symbiodinium microadriaticum]|nr:CHML [Symbiodinium microadriaticum]
MVDSSPNLPDKIDRNTELVQIRRVTQGSPACYGYAMEKDMSSDSYLRNHGMTLSRMVQHNRSFNIDSMPKLLLSAGKMVDLIVASGVGHYLEFKSVDSLFYIMSGKDGSQQTHRVPSSKADIFNSKMFSALEKRMLMKLMQSAVDLGRQQEGLPVETLNETELAQGRALFRPQNKFANSGMLTGNMDANSDKLFRVFLKDSSVHDSLVPFVTHGLSLEPSAECTSARALASLYRHINASGRFGSTSFLMPIYGTSEFTQAFCRLSAVWGGVFVLRESVDRVFVTQETSESGCNVCDNSEVSTMPISPPHEVCGDFATGTVDDAGEICNKATALSHDSYVRAVRLNCGKTVACDFIVCDNGAPEAARWRELVVPTSTHSGGNTTEGAGNDKRCVPDKMWRLVQRHVFANKSVFPTQPATASESGPIESSKGVMIIPPGTAHLANSHAIYVVQLDSSTMVSPVGVFLLYIMTYIDPSGDEEVDSAKAATLMQDVASLLQSLTCHGSAVVFDEIMFATFLHPPVPRLETSNAAWSAATRRLYPRNVIPCDSTREHLLYLHEAAVQAESIFHSICPGVVMFADREDVTGSSDTARHTATDTGDEDVELASLDAILASTSLTGSDTTTEPRSEIEVEISCTSTEVVIEETEK